MTEVPTFQSLAPAAPPYVRAGERVLWQGKPTLAVLVRHGLGLSVSILFFGVFAFGAALRSNSALVALFPFLVAGLIAFVLILNVARLKRTEYVLTDQGVYTRSGVIGQTVVQTTFEKITDISLKQDVLGRLLGYADLHVNTAGSNVAPLRMEGLRDAIGTKAQIEQAREKLFRREAPGARPARRVPRFVPDELLVALTCPTTEKKFRRPQEDLGRDVPCPHCGRTHLAEVNAPGKPGTSRTRPRD